MAQPVHVQQLLKLKQQAVQQQKAIQPQATPGPAAVPQKVPAPAWVLGLPYLYAKSGPAARKETSEMLGSFHVVAKSPQPRYMGHVCWPPGREDGRLG